MAFFLQWQLLSHARDRKQLSNLYSSYNFLKVERVENLRALLKKVSKVETQEGFLDPITVAVGE